jgi:hypothetical protein
MVTNVPDGATFTIGRQKDIWAIWMFQEKRRWPMKGSLNQRHLLRTLLLSLGLFAGISFCGCQSEFGGQTLPSPYYMQDDVQYFPPGPEFKLAREAAAMKAYNEEQTPAATNR